MESRENQWMENGEKGKKRKREKERGGKGWVDGREGKRLLQSLA
jgi:hypothetical protein